MKTYRIPVIWEMWGIIDVEARSLKTSKAKVFEPEIGLPDGHYIEDSFQIDEEGIEGLNDLTNDRPTTIKRRKK